MTWIGIAYVGYFFLALYWILRFAVIILIILALLKYIRYEKQKKENIETIKSLGERIKEYRTKSNMTQEFVAHSLKVSRQAVSKWETGQSVPSTTNILSLSKLFQIPASELLENID